MCRASLVLPVQANSTKVDPQRFAKLAGETFNNPDRYQELLMDTVDDGVVYPGNPASELRLRSRP